MIHATLVLSDALAATEFLGAPLAAFWRSRLDEAGLVLASGGGPRVVVDGRYPAVPADALRALAETLSVSGGALRVGGGAVVATARTATDPGTENPVGWLAHPGGRTLHLADDPGPPVDDGWGLATAERRVVDATLERLARAGVRLHDPARIWVEPGVTVEPGAVLWGGVVLRGRTVIRAGAEIRTGAVLVDTVVGPNTVIKPYTVTEGAHIGPESAVGPMAHLRPGAVLHTDVKVGNFVEVKKAELHDGVRASHLTYLGDATVGAGANVGAGTITCNYDGFGKHRTTIGAGVFVGSNSSLVAPLTLGDGVIVGAGSTVTGDVPADALVVERAPEKVLAGYAPRINERNRLRAERAKRGGRE